MEARLFPEGTVPEFTTAAWYVGRDAAHHVDEGIHQGRIGRAVQMVHAIANGSYGYSTVVDLGAGDGGLLSWLPQTVQRWGYDLCPANIKAAERRGENVQLADVLTDPIDWAEVAICTEMLEHIVDPHGFARTIRSNCKALVASSPYTENADDHYEFHAWAWDEQGYVAMLEQAGWEVVDQHLVGLFQVVLAL